MHIVLAVLSAIGAIAFFIIRANHVAQASRELGEAAGDAKGLVRSFLWRRRTNVDLIRKIDDPRMAATVMMCAMAQSDGYMTEPEKAAILAQMRGPLELDSAEAIEVFAHAHWLTGDMKDLSALLRRASKPIIESCTAAEKADLIEMLSRVAAAEGEPSGIQDDAIKRLAIEFDLPRH
jgi:uncharacterized tellurite resistance protein B-like protein